jgi:stage II sporulation protein D
MDRENAAASIVAAESPPGAHLEACKAQAVVARSFLVAARGRHEGFDFCDTTHCQFLREAPAPGSKAAQAAEETRDLVVAYQGRAIAALYSANCGGKTRTLEDAGWNAEPYPYFAVECPVKGTVAGHRIGMCQEGAAQLARTGKTFREILAHYFPATTIDRF